MRLNLSLKHCLSWSSARAAAKLARVQPNNCHRPLAVTLERGEDHCALLQTVRSNMNKLIFANLLRRPMRSVISVLAVAIEVIMILSIVGIFMGMLNDQKQRTNGIGADLMLLPSNASYFNGVGGASMPIRDEEVSAAAAPRRRWSRRPFRSSRPVATSKFCTGSITRASTRSSPLSFSPAAHFKGPNDAMIVDTSLPAARTLPPGSLTRWAIR